MLTLRAPVVKLHLCLAASLDKSRICWWCWQWNILSSCLTAALVISPSFYLKLYLGFMSPLKQWINECLLKHTSYSYESSGSPDPNKSNQKHSVKCQPLQLNNAQPPPPHPQRTQTFFLAKFLGSFWRPSLQPSPLSHRELVPFEDALSSAAWQAHYRAGGGEIAQLPTGTSWGKSNAHYSLNHISF